MGDIPNNISELLTAASDGSGVVSGVCDIEPVIGLRAARKLLGADGNGISDDYLMRAILRAQQIASSLLVNKAVPKRCEVMYNE
jgi:hypothetical protein